jgi:hypothetical protein
MVSKKTPRSFFATLTPRALLMENDSSPYFICACIPQFILYQFAQSISLSISVGVLKVTFWIENDADDA